MTSASAACACWSSGVSKRARSRSSTSRLQVQGLAQQSARHRRLSLRNRRAEAGAGGLGGHALRVLLESATRASEQCRSDGDRQSRRQGPVAAEDRPMMEGLRERFGRARTGPRRDRSWCRGATVSAGQLLAAAAGIGQREPLERDRYAYAREHEGRRRLPGRVARTWSRGGARAACVVLAESEVAANLDVVLAAGRSAVGCADERRCSYPGYRRRKGAA